MRRGLLLAALLAAGTVQAQGVPQDLPPDGAAAFATRCASCHAVAASAPAGPGPNLAGLIGRRVGTDPRFDYSPVLRAARVAGDMWDAARLREFLEDPEEMYPGLWMGGNVPRRPAERDAILRYFEALR